MKYKVEVKTNSIWAKVKSGTATFDIEAENEQEAVRLAKDEIGFNFVADDIDIEDCEFDWGKAEVKGATR